MGRLPRGQASLAGWGGVGFQAVKRRAGAAPGARRDRKGSEDRHGEEGQSCRTRLGRKTDNGEGAAGGEGIGAGRAGFGNRGCILSMIRIGCVVHGTRGSITKQRALHPSRAVQCCAYDTVSYCRDRARLGAKRKAQDTESQRPSNTESFGACSAD